ncbi:MAG: F0F1 ATP synthase subunit gamma [Candidatus Berkelbacteria bacterium]|nr:F0F1 ATP synthase subunit gamma [Candidatus Berkelbacteria bacterium]
MASTQEFRRRIKSVNNTKQITKAMQMIASIKMQKSVKAASQARAYIQNAWNMLSRLAHQALPENHPLITPRPIKKVAIVLVTSDRGLCGSYNSEVLKRFSGYVKGINSEENSVFDNIVSSVIGLENKPGKIEVDVIAVGKKGAEFVKRYKAGNLLAEFTAIESNAAVEEILPIAKMSIGEFIDGNYDQVTLIYSHYISSLKQIPIVKQLLPIIDEHIDNPEIWTEQNSTDAEFKFEPSSTAVIEGILKQVLQAQIFGAIYEANASMYSSQMVAMQSATDNAEELVDELKLLYNSVRQDGITREIAEISGAADAMK